MGLASSQPVYNLEQNGAYSDKALSQEDIKKPCVPIVIVQPPPVYTPLSSNPSHPPLPDDPVRLCPLARHQADQCPGWASGEGVGGSLEGEWVWGSGWEGGGGELASSMSVDS